MFLCTQFLPGLINSLIESEHPVSHTSPPRGNEGYTPETTMVLVDPPHNLLMCSIAERSIGTHFAVAKFVISAFFNVEGNWSITGNKPFALSVAEWIDLRVTT